MSDPRGLTVPLGLHTFMDRFGPLPANFFNKVPTGAKAVFSTEEGQKPLRSCCFSRPMSPQVVRSDDMMAMMNKVQFLRRTMPDTCDRVRAPKSIWDLYNYFDSLDLWSESAGFLGGVLEEIVLQNDKKSAIIDEHVAELVRHPEVYQQCMKIPLGRMHQLLTPEIRAELGYDMLTKAEQRMTVGAFNRYRQQIEPQLVQTFQIQQAKLDQLATQNQVISHDAVRLANTRVQHTRRLSNSRALSYQQLPRVQLTIAPESTKIGTSFERSLSLHLVSEVHSTSAPNSTRIGMVHELPAMPITPVILSQPAVSLSNVGNGGLREVPNNTIRYKNNKRSHVNVTSRSTSDINNENRNIQKLHTAGNDSRSVRKPQNANQQQHKPNIHREQRVGPIYIHDSQRQPPGYQNARIHHVRHNGYSHHHRSSSNGQFLNWNHGDLLPLNQLYPFPREKTTNRGSWKIAGMDQVESSKHQAYIRDLPVDANLTDDLMIAVSQFGKILSIHFAIHKESGAFCGRAWVGFEEERDLDRAVPHLHGKDLCGKSIRVVKNEINRYSASFRVQSEPKNTSRYDSGYKSRLRETTSPDAKNGNKHDSRFKSKSQESTPTNKSDSSSKSKIQQTTPTETKTGGQHHEVFGTPARARMESQDVRNYLPASDFRTTPNGQRNGIGTSKTPANQTFLIPAYNHCASPHVAHPYVSDLDVVQHPSSYGSSRGYNSVPPRPRHVSPGPQRVPFVKQPSLTARGGVMDKQHDQFTNPDQPPCRTLKENINPRVVAAQCVLNEQVTDNKERVPLEQSNFETSKKMDHTRRTAISRSSSQDVGSLSQHLSTAPVKKKRGARSLSRDSKKSQLKPGRDASSTLPRAKSAEKIRVALPFNSSERETSSLVDDKEKKGMDEASQIHENSLKLPEMTTSDFESRAARISSGYSPKAHETNFVMAPSTGSSLAAMTSVSTNPSGPGTIAVSTRCTSTDDHMSQRSPKETGEQYLDIEQVQDRLNSISKQRRGSGKTEGSSKRENSAHQGSSVRDEEKKTNPTKTGVHSNSSNSHKRKTSLTSISKSKDKKTSMSPKMQSESQQNTATVPTIPSLDDEMQFPALGSSKKPPAVNRNREGSFVAALSGSKQPGEPVTSLCGSLLRRKSTLASPSMSLTNNESQVEKLKATHDEAWPQAHFGR